MYMSCELARKTPSQILRSLQHLEISKRLLHVGSLGLAKLKLGLQQTYYQWEFFLWEINSATLRHMISVCSRPF